MPGTFSLRHRLRLGLNAGWLGLNAGWLGLSAGWLGFRRGGIGQNSGALIGAASLRHTGSPIVVRVGGLLSGLRLLGRLVPELLIRRPRRQLHFRRGGSRRRIKLPLPAGLGGGVARASPLLRARPLPRAPARTRSLPRPLL